MFSLLIHRKNQITPRYFLIFLSISLFYFFESAQMAYYNVLAPSLMIHVYGSHQVAAISAAYFYGDMVGLIPVGYVLDKFSLRSSLMWAIFGSLVGAFILFNSSNFYIQWLARFICGFFGGTFSFLGGIRVISLYFNKHFTYFMSLFLAAGMLGGMLCQYPLLILIHSYGPDSGMKAIFFLGLFVIIFNFIFLKIQKENKCEDRHSQECVNSTWDICKIIGFDLRNWCDVFMVIMLDSPVIIIGALWGIVFLTGYYNFTPAVSSFLVMAMFFGLLAGLPFWGKVADRYGYPAWIIISGAAVCFVLTVIMFFAKTSNSALFLSLLLFGLGFFSSCQSMGFTWLVKGMQPKLIGRNSAFNSMIMMACNGGIKQLGAVMISLPALFFGESSTSNLLLLISIGMLIVVIYASFRKYIFKVIT